MRKGGEHGECRIVPAEHNQVVGCTTTRAYRVAVKRPTDSSQPCEHLNRVVSIGVDYLNVNFAVWAELGEPAVAASSIRTSPNCLISNQRDIRIPCEQLPAPCAVGDGSFVSAVEGVENAGGREVHWWGAGGGAG